MKKHLSLRFLMAFGLAFILSAAGAMAQVHSAQAQQGQVQQGQAQQAKPPSPYAGKTTLIMVDDRNCSWCRKWDREVGVGYAKSKEGQFAPLTRLNRGDAKLGPFRGIAYTPTFILLVDGDERGRIIGYPGADFFWAELDRLIQKGPAVPEIRAGMPFVPRL